MPNGTPGQAEESNGRDLLAGPFNPAWREQAACRGKDPVIFFPERGDSKAMQAALHFCSSCPVKGSCLIENIYEDDGVFGGTSGRQRRLMRSRMGQRRECRGCGITFLRKHPGQWYCTPECRAANQSKD